MDEKKVVKRKKFNFLRFIIFIIILVVIVFLFTNLLKQPIKNIIVVGNNLVTDEEIIETARLEKYPSFIKTTNGKVCKKIKKIDLIKECELVKKWGYVVEINIVENKILFQKRNTNEFILENGEKINHNDKLEGVPVLINYVPDEIEIKLIEELGLIDLDVIEKISEIEYDPTTYDTQRFILYMNDGNMVYITLTKAESLNKYNEIKKELEGKNGILYLDSGNYFEIKE